MKKKRPTECRVLLERLSAYLDRDLPAAQCRTIERHTRDCPRCATMIADLRRTTGLCKRAASRPLPDAVRKRALERVRLMLSGVNE